MRQLGLCLGFLNAMPMTLVGWLVALLGGWQLVRTGKDIWNFEILVRPQSAAGAFMRYRGASAFTLGATILFSSQEYFDSPTTCIHEHRHVYQSYVLGPLQPIAYVLFAAVTAARGLDLWEDNPLEVDAVRAAERGKW